MLPSRASVRVELDPTAKERVEQVCHRKGMTQIAIVSRLVDWFVRQPEVVQRAILGQFSEHAQAELWQRLLHGLAQGENAPTVQDAEGRI